MKRRSGGSDSRTRTCAFADERVCVCVQALSHALCRVRCERWRRLTSSETQREGWRDVTSSERNGGMEGGRASASVRAESEGEGERGGEGEGAGEGKE